MRGLNLLVMSKKDEDFARSLLPLKNINRESLLKWISDEQLSILHAGQPLQIFSGYLAAAVIAMVCWYEQPSATILFWFFAVCSAMTCGFITFLKFKDGKNPNKKSSWEVSYVAWLSICAVAWSILVWLVPAKSPAIEAAQFIMLTAVMTCGAAQQYAYSPAAVTFTVVMTLVMGLKFIVIGDIRYVIIGVGYQFVGVFICLANIGINRSVTRSILLNKALDMQLKQSHSDRESLRVANEELMRANAAKSRFLAAASHDLRQPMHAIGLLTGALRRKPQNEDKDRTLAMIEHSVDALQSLFNGILDVSRLDSEDIRVAKSAVEIDKVFEMVVVQYDALAKKKGIVLEWRPSGAVVFTDGMLLSRVISNLVSNAIMYTRSGRVLLRSRVRLASVSIQIWDTGIGIPRSLRVSIFEEFFQIGNPQRDSNFGVGLGLSIVKRTAKLLGAGVGVLSKLGKGSLFTLTLPLLERANFLPNICCQDGETKMLDLFVLIVEDDPHIQNATAELLRQFGCQCVVAGSFSEALNQVSVYLRIPDLLICDYRLGPEGDGVDVIQAIRQRTETDIPALLISGDLLSTPPSLPYMRFLSKPLSAHALRDEVEKCTAFSTV